MRVKFKSVALTVLELLAFNAAAHTHRHIHQTETISPLFTWWRW